MADRSVSINLRARVSDFVSGMGQAKRSTEDLSRQMVQTGAYADQFRRRLEAATKALPKIEIDADSSPAEIKFAQLRAEMEKLADKKIGIDIDAASAQAQLQEIERELEKLQGQSATVDVKADIGAALAELRAVDAEVSRVNGSDANVRVDADVSGALAGIAMVGAALASLPAVTSIAVGVTALGGAFAAAGIGAVAFGAAAVPALSRINEALKAQETAAKSAGSATGGAGQSAAQAAQQALQLEQAERRLKDAQNEERAAQEDLTRAREAGRRALEDMNFSLERSILSQKDAALAVREAEARLAEVQSKHSEGKASDLELERAMLGLEMAQQRSREQEVKTQRARKDTAEANKAGVKGTAEYQKGLDKLKQAQDKVAQAEQQLKMLHLQQQAAMSSGGGGAKKTADAFAGLNKQEIELAKNIKSFKDEYVDWQRALEPDVLPVIAQGLDLMRLGLKEAAPMAKSASKALLTLGKDAEKSLRGPFWQDFFDDVNREIPDAITGLGRTGGNVFKGLAGVVQAFLPYTKDVVGGIEDMSEKFADWGAGLKDSPEFHDFIAYAKENGPKVVEIVKDLAVFIGKIASVGAGLGPGVLDFMVTLADKLAGMDAGQIEAIAKGVGLIFAAAKIGAALKLGALVILADVLSKMTPGQIQATAIAIGAVVLAVKGFQAVQGARSFLSGLNVDMEKTGKSASGLKGKLGDLAGSIKGVAVVEAALLTRDVSPTVQKYVDGMHATKVSVDEAAKSIRDMTTAALGYVTSAVAFNQATEHARSVLELKQAFKEAKSAIDASSAGLDLNKAKTDAQKEAVIRARDAFVGFIEKAQSAALRAGELAGKQGAAAQKSDEARDAILKQLPHLGELAGKNQAARDQVLKLAEAYGISRTDAEKAMKGADGLREVLAKLKSKEIRVTADTEPAKQALRDLLDLYIKPVEIPVGVRAPSTPPKKKKERGGIERYASGGIRSVPPHIADRPTVLYGEGRAPEAFIPLDPAFRDRAIGLLGQVADKFGLEVFNKNASRSMSDLSVTIDGSGMQVAGGLQAAMGSLESTMGAAGSLTSSIAKVGSSADQLDAAWLSGSAVIGDSIDLLGAGVADMSSTVSTSVDGLSESVHELTKTMGNIKSGSSSSKSKGSSKAGSSKGGMVAGNQPLKKPPGGMVAGSQPSGGFATSFTAGDWPTNSSRVSAPQQVSHSTYTSTGAGALNHGGSGAGGAGSSGGGYAPVQVQGDLVVNSKADADYVAERLYFKQTSRG